MSPSRTLHVPDRHAQGLQAPAGGGRVQPRAGGADRRNSVEPGRGSATKDDLDELGVRIGQRFDQVDERFQQVERRFERVDNRFEQIDKRFERVDERFRQVDDRLDQMDERLTQRIELSEQRTEKQISQLQSDLYRVLLIGFGALSALIIILNYVTG